ncbi:GNAT family N-acetyltransferase [Paenibacillus prosopidis]|uniref:Ribosomal-protein-alanine N-acetyltransferase n=1 Tax=Paenibacillus prosopidis TaxID=630520 RepID=A0A368VIY7_9BACL|nr:GNAT family N-acetyltransferase [Paenibacillus prosopidis]RCW39624.1 ribosomal-protein-alanine N-acetyltransferase [Paenibacillus prosopidis]
MDVDKIFLNPPVFETERLILRKLEMSDAKKYFEFATDPVVSVETLWDRHITVNDTIHYLQKVMHKFESKQAIRWGVINKLNNKLIGRTGLISIDSVHEKAEIGYALSSEYWNQGIITEATRKIIHYSFLEVGINRIEARCNYNNTGSYCVLEKLGMTYEGTLRSQLKIKGKFIDQRIYSVLRSNYVPIQD